MITAAGWAGRWRSHGRCSPAPGFVLVSALSGALMLVLILVAVWSQLAADRALARQEGLRAGTVARAQAALQAWLRAHLADLDASAPPAGGWPDPTDALAGLVGHAQLQVGLSAPLTRDSVQCRILGVWWPGVQGTTVFDPASGRFAQVASDTHWALVDGCSEERSAVVQAQQRLNRLAGVLERWFQARLQDDPLHRRDRDHFADPAGTCAPAFAALPCLETFTVAASVPALQALPGFAPADLVSPWGSAAPIELRNPPGDAQTPPFQVFLQLRTPWGGLLTARAVQPGA